MHHFLSAIKVHFKRMDFVLLGAALLCSGFGLLLVMAATATSSTVVTRSFLMQSAALVIGLVGMLVLYSIDIEVLSDLWVLLYGVAVATILITILFGKGPTAGGNQNWIYLGPISVQPTEFVKIAYIVVLAKALDRVGDTLNTLPSLLYVGGIAGSILLLMLVQGDTGTTLVFLCFTVVMLFAAGLDWRFFAAAAAVVVAAAPFVWVRMPAYMQARILVGFRPELDPLDMGFQAIQSKIAIGSGQLFGKGFLQGTQIDLLPARETDFLYATAGEEFGFVGSMLILLLLTVILLRILQAARSAQSNVSCLICIGVFGMFFGQVFENIGMCLAILPVVGITLPFFSYGGSSMISCWLAVGLVLAVHRQTMNTLSFDL
ncbi:MAG: rod shape-determining protein RodA [Clostridia bacterium]|nr:rod shape-determining protein RodA [Clostridia bacterium]